MAVPTPPTDSSALIEVERDPIQLVKQYTSDQPVRIRRNAATALATLTDSPASAATAARALIDMALQEKDEQVSYHILSELSELGDTGRHAVMSRTRELVETGGDQTRHAAYSLLVRFRALGWNLPLSPLKGGLRESWMAMTGFDAARGRRFSWPFLGAVLTAALFSSLLTMLYVMARITTGGASGFLVVLVGVAALVAVALTLAVSRVTVPGYLHLRRRFGNVLDISVTVVLTGTLWFFTILIVQVATEFQESMRRALEVAGLSAIIVSAAIGAVRIGSLTAHERPPADRLMRAAGWRGRLLSGWVRRRLIGEILLGVAFGLLAVAIVDWLTHGVLSIEPGSAAARILEGSRWLALVAVPPAAVAFAMIDRPTSLLKWLAHDRGLSDAPGPAVQRSSSVPDFVARWPWGRAVRRLLEVGGLVFLGYVTVGIIRKASKIAVTPYFAATEPTVQDVWMMGFPIHYDFSVGFMQPFIFETGIDSNLNVRAELYTWPAARYESDGRPICIGADRTDRETVFDESALKKHEENLGRGCYALQLTRTDDSTGRVQAVRPILNALSRHRADPEAIGSTSTPAVVQPYQLKVTVNRERFQRTDPLDPGIAEKEVRVRWWEFQAVPWSQEIRITRPMAVRTTLTPAFLRVVPEAPTRASPATQTDRENSGQNLEVKWTQDNKPIEPGNILVPGTYTITVTGQKEGKGRMGWVSLDLAGALFTILDPMDPRPDWPVIPTKDLPVVVGSEPFRGTWSFDRTPARFPFRLTVPRRLMASVPKKMIDTAFSGEWRIDLELSLERDGRHVRTEDDPEDMFIDLEPGDYVLLIRTYGDEQSVIATDVGNLWLALEFGPAKTAAGK